MPPPTAAPPSIDLLLPWALSGFLAACILLLAIWIYSLLRRLKAAAAHHTLLATLREEHAALTAKADACQQQNGDLLARLQTGEATILQLTAENASLHRAIADLQNRLDGDRQSVETLRQSMTDQFSLLSHQLLETHAKNLLATNEKQMGDLLHPLRERLSEFQQALLQLNTQGAVQHTELQSQLARLHEANHQMEAGARDLVNALKGQKTQGNWGELTLERLLESSGLTEGREYRRQPAITLPDGSRLQPDVIVDLPDDHHLVIDAKVSLTAFVRLHETSHPDHEALHLKEHLASLRTHIDGLARKNYDSLPNLRSPDFVLLFIPVEPALHAALRADPLLFEYAFHKRIILVSPTTLLATLKTVSSLWRLENQNRNAIEIARLGGELYDKFVLFCEDLDEVGHRLEQARNAHEQAKNKLALGRGNALRTIERMRELGLKTKKNLPPHLLDHSRDA